jgi:phosphate starvation-inducible protein PhoH and related proteins
VRKIIEFKNSGEALDVCGPHDENLKIIGAELPASIINRGSSVAAEGEAAGVEAVLKVFSQLVRIARGGRRLHPYEVRYIARSFAGGAEQQDIAEVFLDRIEVSSKRRFVLPKTRGQKEYVDAIRSHDIVFGIGPAGTGKTYLAMAAAVSCLRRRDVDRIILTRPAIEAGESLGFLPGGLHEKVSPYLRPLYDALYDMMEADEIGKNIDRGVIEIAPLAYMRGRTLNDAFIILDEAQNSTSEQMKMFLTRLGFGSKTVITGDVTQVDLPRGRLSGLVETRKLLAGIGGIKFVYFDGRDVVRHELVQ